MRITAHVALRMLTDEEARVVQAIARASSERADVRQRAIALGAVAAGQSHEAAARHAGYAKGYTVSQLVQRFNRQGLRALTIAAGRGRKPTYTPAQRADVIQTLTHPPEATTDGTKTWSVTTLQRRLRGAGLSQISRDTIHHTLHAAGYSYQRTRTWCLTGQAKRKRKCGVVTVTDPLATQKRG
jgi:transposase